MYPFVLASSMHSLKATNSTCDSPNTSWRLFRCCHRHSTFLFLRAGMKCHVFVEVLVSGSAMISPVIYWRASGAPQRFKSPSDVVRTLRMSGLLLPGARIQAGDEGDDREGYKHDCGSYHKTRHHSPPSTASVMHVTYQDGNNDARR